MNEDIKKRASKIKLLLMDCDGVLTDGKITLLPNGDEQKTFNVRDGLGIVSLHKAGIQTGIISGRSSSVVERRAKELGIKFLQQGHHHKTAAFEQILREAEMTAEQTAYVGDDFVDIPILKLVGLAIAVNDAVDEVKENGHYITKTTGGNGAVREICDLILKSQNKWLDLIKSF
ncbi:MAG: HAD-IIIA family hydrolase [Pyrinomonadaceae bacterium]|nr:HAD-IIIA family hydrolase [Pyrinomonadaceae bacterium]